MTAMAPTGSNLISVGGVGAAIGNPTDLIKVRLQAEGRLPPGVAKRHNGVISAFRDIIKYEGLVSTTYHVPPSRLIDTRLRRGGRQLQNEKFCLSPFYIDLTMKSTSLMRS